MSRYILSPEAPKLLLSVLVPVALVGAGVGLVLGVRYVVAGFPLLAVDAVRRSLDAVLVGIVGFTLLYAGVRRLLGERLRDGWALAFAAALAAAPFVAFAGYHLNRARAVKPREILEPWALVPNLWLLAGCGVLWGAACLLLRWAEARRPRPHGAVAVGLVLLMLHSGLALAFRREVKTGPDVFILLVDALRADRLGCYGHSRDTTPAIDRLARDSVLFRQAISQSTFTKTSIASLFTGKNPYRHGIYWGQRQLSEDALSADILREEETTLAERFANAGYLTGAWVQNSHLRGVMGFGQGFLEYHDQQGRIDRIHDAFDRFLDAPARRYSFLAYLHYIDLHDPYRPEPPYDTFFGPTGDVYAGVDFSEWGSHLAAIQAGRVPLTEDDVESLGRLYDGQLRFIDERIGRFLDKLRRRGLYEKSLIVLTADHGDGFMEHGLISHSTMPYDELVRVPLLVKLPEGRHAGRQVAGQVRLIDVLPTLLELAGLHAGRLDIDGCSLVPRLEGEAPPGEGDPCALAVIEIADEVHDNAYPTLALRTESLKYIHQADRRDELYDLAADPGEQENLVDVREADATAFREMALQLVAARQTGVERLELDEQTLRELKALGYVGGEPNNEGEGDGG